MIGSGPLALILELALLALSHLSRALREEEPQAWKCIIRVLSHEINNSLAPIKSMAGSLESMLARSELPEEVGEDLETRRPVEVLEGKDAVIQADPDQLEQALINLVRNAVDATLETDGAGVTLRWISQEGGAPADRGRGTRTFRYGQPLRPVRYDQAGRLRDRIRPLSPDRRGPRGYSRARKSAGIPVPGRAWFSPWIRRGESAGLPAPFPFL